MPPEGGVISYLNRAGFNPSAVRPAARAFLETAQELEKMAATESHFEGRDKGLASDFDDDEAPPSVRNRKREMRPGMKEDVYTLQEGDVVFQWPESLSQESYTDLKEWMDLVLRKVKRHVASDQGDDVSQKE